MSNEHADGGTIDYPGTFADRAVSLVQSATRYVAIQSPELDHAVFDSAALVDAMSALARSSRQTQIRILVCDTRRIVSRGHRLLELSRRLPSAIHIRKLDEHPSWNGETLVLRDRNGFLLKPADSGHRAFYEEDARAATQRHLEQFQDLWRLSQPDPNLRALSL